jgi:Glu-tRNA(Gln) amidotransferase subunit E-like FAD-binding protein
MASEENLPPHSDLVTVFRLPEGGIDESEVVTVQRLLEANGIATVLVGDSPLPNFAEEVRVAPEDAERARQIIEEAKAAGPAAAEQGESDYENPQA